MFDMLHPRLAMIIAAGIIFFGGGIFLFSLLPPASAKTFTPVTFHIAQGDGFREIGTELEEYGLIRSEISFAAYAVLTGTAGHFREGAYYVTSPASVPDLIARFTKAKKEITVRIPGGSTVRGIDALLAKAGVIPPESLLAIDKKEGIEGHLFPDTYQFFADSDPQDVLGKFLDNFNAKAMSVLLGDKTHLENNLILASLLEKEVPNYADQEIVAGILDKRIAQGIPLDLDATICYIKTDILLVSENCYPLSPSDFKINSPFNTYQVKGLPPGPIGSPDAQAIQAALHPKSSPYFYYLSNPKTGNTIFAKTLEEQSKNRAKYLGT